MLQHYFPPGLLGLGLTALMASFMSGMAGNVTAFNTVWTYDIYQSYIKQGRDRHAPALGRPDDDGVRHPRLSVGTAYLATRFNNIMDLLQLVFAFVNAPLFATFLLGMFWRRATGHGAFFGLLLRHARGRAAPRPHAARGRRWPGSRAVGSAAARCTCTRARWRRTSGPPSGRGRPASLATIVISLLTARTKTDEELTGLVYSLTPRRKDDDTCRGGSSPRRFGVVVLVLAIVLNVIFW